MLGVSILLRSNSARPSASSASLIQASSFAVARVVIMVVMMVITHGHMPEACHLELELIAACRSLYGAATTHVLLCK